MGAYIIKNKKAKSMDKANIKTYGELAALIGAVLIIPFIMMCIQ